MSDEKEFIEGLYFNEPREGAPDFVKGSLGIQRDRFVKWLQAQPDDKVKIDLKVSRAGKWYAEKNDWKLKEGGNRETAQRQESAPEPAPADNGFADDEIPWYARSTS